VSLSATSTQVVTVDVATADGTAVAPADYTSKPLTKLTFAVGQTTQTVTVPIVDDLLAEGSEKFYVVLSNAVNGIMGYNKAVATISDNEPSPCNAPTYNAGTEAAVFMWKDCTTGNWSMRVTAGGGSKTYTGSVVSNQPFSSVVPVSVEFTSGDVLDSTSDPTKISYNLATTSNYLDGMDFSFPATATACVHVDVPVGAKVYVGSARTLVSPTFNLATLGACGP